RPGRVALLEVGRACLRLVVVAAVAAVHELELAAHRDCGGEATGFHARILAGDVGGCTADPGEQPVTELAWLIRRVWTATCGNQNPYSAEPAPPPSHGLLRIVPSPLLSQPGGMSRSMLRGCALSRFDIDGQLTCRSRHHELLPGADLPADDQPP